MSKIYTPDGWVNWSYIVDQCRAFMMVVGGRGVGKTYGLLRHCIEKGVKFIYLRRLKTQLDSCTDADGNPFKKINADMGETISPVSGKGGIRFYRTIENGGKALPSGEPLGYGLALSTVATIRGMDFSDVEVIVFDEAIPMEGERTIKKEFEAFLNFYETVNRNRELTGESAVKAILLGNANKLANPYFSGWHLMRRALNMIRGGQMVYRDKTGGLTLIMLLHSPISEKKRETSVYKIGDGGLSAMALDNAFYTDASSIRSYNLRECRHLVSVGEIGIFIHKGNGRHYVSKVVNRDHYYNGDGIELRRFNRDYILLKDLYFSKLVDFEDFESELLFREYLSLN